MGRNNQTTAIEKRIRQAWAAFGKLSTIFLISKTYIKLLKNTLYNQLILHVFPYVAETVTLTHRTTDEFTIPERKMSRITLGINLKKYMSNIQNMEQAKVIDVIQSTALFKMNWVATLRESGKT